MLKNYLEERGLTIYAIAKRAGIPYSTLNDIANGRVDVENCKVGIVLRISETIGISLDELLKICSSGIRNISTSYGINAAVTVRNKTYYADFTYNGEHVELQLCKVNENTSYYISDIARWRTEGYIRKYRMENPQWNIF